jgi:uncharacterized membrane protein
MSFARAQMAVVAFAAVLCAACGGSDLSCPNDPVVCPSPAPSYSTTVSTIIQNRCLSCHGPGGQWASKPFTTYQEVYTNRSAILNQVYACRMPPAGATQPTPNERAQIIGWLACGAPNN